MSTQSDQPGSSPDAGRQVDRDDSGNIRSWLVPGHDRVREASAIEAELDQAGDLTAVDELPPPSPPSYVVRIDIDEAGHADIDAVRPRAYVIAALRHIADELEAQG